MLRWTGDERRNPHVPPTSVSRSGSRSKGRLRNAPARKSSLPLGKLRALSLAGIMALSGCSVLAPRQDRTRFIMLTASTPRSLNMQSAANPTLASAAIGLGPVQLPEYLDGPELLIRTSPNGFELSNRDRWAESLADNFRHVLANDLTNLLGAKNIVQYPWYPGTRLNYIVHIQVEHFEADTNQTVELTASWELITTQTDQILASREAQFSRPLTSLAGETAAAALSEDVAELAAQIASTIVQAERQRLAQGPR
jgi:uncharacterized lipoprotein YmbA